MPCRDDDYPYDREARRELDRVTRLLCEALTFIPSELLHTEGSKELVAWKLLHEEADRRRKVLETEEKQRKAEAAAKRIEDERILETMTKEQRALFERKGK